jgi:hypothetical protein
MAVKYGWETEGRMAWLEYPRARQWDAGSSQWVERDGRRLQYGYDAMGRPTSVKDLLIGQNFFWASGAEYNAAGQMVRFSRGYGQRTYQYNVGGSWCGRRTIPGTTGWISNTATRRRPTTEGLWR